LLLVVPTVALLVTSESLHEHDVLVIFMDGNKSDGDRRELELDRFRSKTWPVNSKIIRGGPEVMG